MNPSPGSPIRISTARAAQLARLASGQSLPKSKLSRPLLAPLQHAGAVILERSGSSYVVRGIPDLLAVFVEHEWGIRDLSAYAASAPGVRSRASMAEITEDSKALPSSPLEGLFFRTFGVASVDGQPLSPTPPEIAHFISPRRLQKLHLGARILIGIENPECLKKFENCLPHFPALDLSSTALVLRWSWGAEWRAWVSQWSGTVWYFPDFDPAGLSIFATQVLKVRPDARILTPMALPALLKERGNRKLYLNQEHLLLSLPNHAELMEIQRTIQEARKGLEQESLLY